jgi:hypothetical protein
MIYGLILSMSIGGGWNATNWVSKIDFGAKKQKKV